MSSYYTTAQLLEMQRARIRAELNSQIEKLQSKLREEHKSEAVFASAPAIRITVTADDNGTSGYEFTGEIASEAHDSAVEAEIHEREGNDLSSLLGTKKRPSAAEKKLRELVDRVSGRAILTARDIQDRTRLLAELSRIMNDPIIDIEDKLNAVEMRVKSYLQGGVPADSVDMRELEERYIEYCTLCELLGEEPAETLPETVRSECERMKKQLEKKKQDEYIMETLDGIMEQLGLRVKGEAVLDHTEGRLFSVDGDPLCDVFVGADGSGIMFEPVAGSRGGSEDRRRRIEKSANSICAMYARIEEMAAERGVILRRVYADPASADSVCVQSDLRESTAGKQQRKAQGQKPKAREAED